MSNISSNYQSYYLPHIILEQFEHEHRTFDYILSVFDHEYPGHAIQVIFANLITHNLIKLYVDCSYTITDKGKEYIKVNRIGFKHCNV